MDDGAGCLLIHSAWHTLTLENRVHHVDAWADDQEDIYVKNCTKQNNHYHLVGGIVATVPESPVKVHL